jgi:glycyl-tRNA synthetase alpha chain
MKEGLVLAAYECCLKCSHTFNVLDARGAISVTERAQIIGRVRGLAVAVAKAYVESRKQQGYPLLRSEAGKEASHAV